MKIRFFDSFAEFEMSGTAGNYEEVTVIRENGWIKCDLMTECKSYKTALRRFFKALANVPEVSGWYEDMSESAENGYFQMNDNMMADGTRNPFPGYAWEIEDHDGAWYIFLNVKTDEPEDPAAKKFPKLCEAVHAEALSRMDGKKFYIENGYCRTWAAEHRGELDRALRKYLTPAKWDAYKAGTLSREAAVLLATERAFSDVKKWEAQQLEKLRTAAAAPVLSFLSVDVEWKRNSYWGNNPTATAWADGGTTTGHASGCGYDKESAAVGEALNQSPAVLRVLYEAAEAALQEGRSFETLSSGCVSWREVLGYGSGYNILPYFEGGVGVSCFWSILSRCGFSCRSSAGGRHFDHYTAERKGA